MFRRLRSLVRNGPCGQLVLDSLWTRVRLLDGRRRWLPRGLGLLMRTVRQDQGFEQECRLVYDHYPGGDFLDVGAETGTYSLVLGPKAGRGARLASFEPNPPAFRRLQFNLAALGNVFPDAQFMALPH